MESNRLSKVLGKLGQHVRTDLGLYRLLAVFAALSVVVFRPMLPDVGIDPMWMRLTIGAIVFSFGFSSFFIPFVRRNIAAFAHATIYIVCAWAVWLTFQNDFEKPYVVNFFIVVLFSALNFRSLKAWVPFSIVVLIGHITTCLVVDFPAASLWQFSGLIIFTLVISAAMVVFRSTIQSELNKQGQFVASIFENSPDAIFLAYVDDLNVFKTNKLASTLLGADEGNDRAALHLHLSKWFKRFWNENKASGRQTTYLQKLDGGIVWADVVVTKISGKYDGEYLVSISDITDRKQIEQRLQLSDDILKKVDHLVIVCDADTNIVYITPSVESMLGYKAEDMLGQGWWNKKRESGIDISKDIAHVKNIAAGTFDLNHEPYENIFVDAEGNQQWMMWQDYLTETGLVMGVGMLNTKAKKNALIRSVVFSIAEASSKVQSPIEFYHNIHQEIRRIINTPNFYIAVYNADVNEVAFPYYSDSEESDYLARSGHKRKAGKGLTEYVIQQKKPQLLSQNDVLELQNAGLVSISGTTPKVWLGVPMLHEDRVVGLMTVQNYQDANAYSQDDLVLVNFVASQVAQFVAKLQADEALKVSEERFRSIYDQAAVGIAQLAPKGNFLQVNQKMEEIFGYTAEELSLMAPNNITHPDDLELGQGLLEEVLEGARDSYTIEKRYLHKEGKTIHALLNVSAYREEGVPVFIISVYEDITEKKRAQEETELLLRLITHLNAADDLAEVMEIAAYELSKFGEWSLADASWVDGTGAQHQLAKAQCANQNIVLKKRSTPPTTDEIKEEDREKALIWLDRENQAIFPYEASQVALMPVIHDQKVLAVFSLFSWEEGIYRPALEKIAIVVGAQLLTVMLQKMSDAARVESENRYRAITQAAFDGIAIYQDGKFQDINTAFAKIFDYAPEEISGISIEDLIYAESPAAVAAEIVEGESSEVEFEGRKKGGKAIFLESLSRDDIWKGKPAKILAIRDISSEKLVEEARAVARIDARFKAYVQNSSEIIQILDTEGRIQYCSPSASRLLDQSPDSFIGQIHSELVHDDDRENYLLVLEDVMRVEGSSAQLQLRIVLNDGKAKFLQVNMTNLLDDPLIKGILVSAGDISNVIEAQQSMKESEERYRALVDNATEAIFVVDIDKSALTEVNKNAETLFGYDREDLIGLDPLALNAQSQTNERAIEYAKRALKGEVVTYEWLFQNAFGKTIPCEVRLNRFPSAKHRLVRGSVTDITDRKLAEEKMRRSREMLQLQNEKLIELAASYELNSGDLDTAFEEITKAMASMLMVSKTSIWLFDNEGQSIICRKEYELEADIFGSGKELAVSEFPNYFKAIRQARVLAVEDVNASEVVAEFSENYFEPQNIQSVLDAPFRHGGEIAGVIWNENMGKTRVWEQEELNFIASIADMVTLALQSWEKKKAEDELESTLTKMRATFDSTRDGIVLVDPYGNLLDYNHEYHKLSKIPLEVLDAGGPNAGFDILVSNVKDQEPFLEAVARMQENPDAGERYIYQTTDELVIEIYARKMVVDGELRGRLWFLHDLTDLKRIETALLENETKYRSIFSQANDSIILLEGEKVLECNDQAEQMFGRKREEIIGMRPHELSPKYQPDGTLSTTSSTGKIKAALDGQPQHFYWQHERADGSPFDAEVSLNRIQIGEKIYIQALVRDITERLKTENALRNSERKNKALLDGIPDLIIRMTKRGTILDMKLSDNQDLVRAGDEALGRPIENFLPSQIAETLITASAQTIETGESQQFESELITEADSMDYETRIVPSGPGEVLVIIRDVTERKATEKELIKRNFELDSFVYRASHDLKAPLNSLMGLISLVESETEEAGVLNYIKMMNKSVTKLDAFIRDLADFSRNARMEMEHTEVNWQAIIDETLENLQFSDNSDRIKKTITINQNAPFFADGVRIGIMFNNLISNAIKYQNLKRDDAFVKVTIESDKDQAVVSIEDNGIGISADHQAKVYNLFFRASIQSYGSGMGMYIVKNAIDKLRGEISLNSTEGEGTTFTITIPNHGFASTEN